MSLWQSINTIVDGLKQKQLADVFRFISFNPFEIYGLHRHTRIEINFVRKGSCILHLSGNESITFSVNEMMIIHSNVDHMFEAGPKGVTLMQLEFMPEILDYFDLTTSSDFANLAPCNLFSQQNQLIKIVNNVHMMRVVQRIVNELKDKGSYHEHLVVMYYAELLILIYRHISDTYMPLNTNSLMTSAVDYIRKNFDSDININRLATHVGISERYLRKLFSSTLNLSPLDYLNQIRINKSIELLKHTDLSIKEVSFMCGFKSPQYFSRVFKSHMNMTPRELAR